MQGPFFLTEKNVTNWKFLLEKNKLYNLAASTSSHLPAAAAGDIYSHQPTFLCEMFKSTKAPWSRNKELIYWIFLWEIPFKQQSKHEDLADTAVDRSGG